MWIKVTHIPPALPPPNKPIKKKLRIGSEATKKRFGIKASQTDAKDEDENGREQDSLLRLPLKIPPELRIQIWRQVTHSWFESMPTSGEHFLSTRKMPRNTVDFEQLVKEQGEERKYKEVVKAEEKGEKKRRVKK